MSLDKSIASGREKRQPYRGSGRFDRTCRNHGRCPYCANNRQHPQRKADLGAAEQLHEWSTAEAQRRRDEEDALWEACFADEQREFDETLERLRAESDYNLATEDYLNEE
jgi:hypothetical protein